MGSGHYWQLLAVDTGNSLCVEGFKVARPVVLYYLHKRHTSRYVRGSDQ